MIVLRHMTVHEPVGNHPVHQFAKGRRVDQDDLGQLAHGQALISSAGLFGVVNQVFTFAISPVFGEVALLVAAVILLRLLPQGVTARFFKGKM